MIRHIRWQILLVLVGVGLLVALLAYVAVNFTTEWVAGSGGTYVEGLAGSPRFINPLLCQAYQADGDLCALIFNGLTRIDHHGQILPDLAERWVASPDGLTYTFHLRRGARWHDGTALTADDVLFTIELLQDPSFPGPADWGDLWRTVTAKEVDARTIEFSLEEPFAPFLDYTAVGILPRHLLHGVAADELLNHPFNLNPIGTGIFRFSEIVTGTNGISHVILEANPYFLGRKPLISRIQFKFYPDYETVYQAYLDDEVQGIGWVATENLIDARSNPELQLYTSVIPRFTMIYLNLTSRSAPFFADREVRQALMYALDRQMLIDRVLDGQAIVADSPILPDSWAYDPTVPNYQYNPQKAVELLAEAGWEPRVSSSSAGLTGTIGVSPTVSSWTKGGLPLSFSLLVADGPLQVAAAQEISRQWAQVGIQVDVAPLATGLLSARLIPRRYKAAMVDLDLTLTGDPDPYPFWHQTQIDPPGQNYAGYDSREMSEILETARITPDQEARKRLYHEFQQLFASDVPAILLFHPVYTYALDRYVRGANSGPLARPGDRFQGIADWYVRWRRVIRSDVAAEAGKSIAP